MTRRGIYVNLTQSGVSWEIFRLRENFLSGIRTITDNRKLMYASFAAVENEDGTWKLVKSRISLPESNIELYDILKMARLAYAGRLLDREIFI